ncbi:MAG: sodium:proton antiporter [Firmicutes bacterium]|nr:sodium:proton antiporter [Bacillota bacterium]
MRDFVLKRVVALVLPFVTMLGLYVIFHGHLSPGGSFSGGIITGLSMIAFSLVFGLDRSQEKISERMMTLIESFGALWYGAMGLVGILRGTSFLMNKGAGIPLGEPGKLYSGGLILLITLGVGLKVASTMVTLFVSLMEEEEE